MNSKEELLESDKLYVRLQAKLEYLEKRLASSMNDYLNTSKKVDRDKCLAYRAEMNTVKTILEMIKE